MLSMSQPINARRVGDAVSVDKSATIHRHSILLVDGQKYAVRDIMADAGSVYVCVQRYPARKGCYPGLPTKVVFE